MEQKVWSSRECSMNSKEISRGCFSKWKHISADSEAGQKSSGYRIPILIIRDSQAKIDCLKVMSIFFKFSHVLSLVEQPPLKSRKWEVRIVFRKKKKFKQRNIHQPSHIYNGGGGGCTGCQGSCETFERKVTIVFLCSLSFEVAVYGTGLFFLAYPKITFRFWLSPLDRNFKFRLQIKFKNWNFKSWVQSLQSTFRFYKIIIQNQRGCLLYIQIWSKSLNAKFSKSTLGLCWSR